MKVGYEAQDWALGNHGGYVHGEDAVQSPRGARTGYIKSQSEAPKKFGFIYQTTSPTPFSGGRVQMTAVVKTVLEPNATAQLWIRVDGDWKKNPECFDNMYEHRIHGTTDWKEFRLVVSVPQSSSNITFGILLNGKGQAWIGDVALERVGASVPLTGVVG